MAKYLVATRNCSEVREANTKKQLDKARKDLQKRYKKILVYKKID